MVPVAHPAAFAANTRTGPDGDNLARVFPGKADGTPTERVAAVLTEQILSKADALVDLHTAGRHYDMALLAGFGSSGPGPVQDTARKMAEAFGADVVWLHPGTSTGRTLSVMQERGKPAIVEGALAHHPVDGEGELLEDLVDGERRDAAVAAALLGEQAVGVPDGGLAALDRDIHQPASVTRTERGNAAIAVGAASTRSTPRG